MKNILVLCNHSSRSEASTGSNFDKIIPINATLPDKNLKISFESLTHEILSNFSPLAQDLLEIASYVYYADCSVPRSSNIDVFARNWIRKFEFVIPVSNPNIWNSTELKNALIESLHFLSGDEFSFTFLPSRTSPVQLFFDYPDVPEPFFGADFVSLFSGGIDSLIGSLHYFKKDGERPLLISHRSHPKMDRSQKGLAELLRARNSEWSFPHLSIWINRLRNRAVENTQRTRSFLYLSIAAAVASELRIERIQICDNGITSINIPISPQNIGTLLTRSTHPRFVKLYEQFTRNLFDNSITIENPFILHTKSQMLNLLESWNQSELVQTTNSCSNSQGRTRFQPSCGTCFQCVNRRFSVISAGLEEYDRADYYEKDFFLDSLDEGIDRQIPIEYVRSAIEIYNMGENQFFEKYSKLNEVIDSIHLPSNECAEKIYELFKRHAAEVINVLNSKYQEHSSDFLSGRLPGNCLISITHRLSHLAKPIDEFIERIWVALNQPLKNVFQTRRPSSEIEVQDAGKGLLDAAGNKLRRESPMLSFACVRTVPDFSNFPDLGNMLFIEFKFVNSRNRLRQIITEITSRITIYTVQGAYILFVVYDANNIILNDEEFISDLEVNDKIKVKIVR